MSPSTSGEDSSLDHVSGSGVNGATSVVRLDSEPLNVSEDARLSSLITSCGSACTGGVCVSGGVIAFDAIVPVEGAKELGRSWRSYPAGVSRNAHTINTTDTITPSRTRGESQAGIHQPG